MLASIAICSNPRRSGNRGHDDALFMARVSYLILLGGVFMSPSEQAKTGFGSPDLRLPDELRGPLLAHLRDLHAKYLRRGWAGRVGFGTRPALVVIDLARFWLDAR